MKNRTWEGSWIGRAAADPRKVTPACEEALTQAVDHDPRDAGYEYSTWSARTLCVLLIVVCCIVLSPRSIRRHLRRLGYRLVRPVPFVASPDPQYQEKAARLEELRQQARDGKIVLVYEDEVDLHLLPGVTRCWTRKGRQKRVRTPGKNVKRYGYGAVDMVSGHIVFQTSEHKNSASFVLLVKALLNHYENDDRPIVLVLDNYKIHSSQITQKGLAPLKDRLSTFFLPTYSPHLNVIELLWKHVRRNVTHNHLFESIEAVVNAVTNFIQALNRSPYQVCSVIASQ
ncbi:MAG TPA: IS630 family transposase [Candidatus Saccharimonadales bacterium]|nr:IS630 family transposase [Candidatus Saccharimonadales bacterium]